MQGQVDDANLTSPALGGLTEEQTERLTELLDQYLASLEAGQPLSRDALVADHTDLREALDLYLDKLNELHNFSAGFSPHLAGASSSVSSPSGNRVGFAEATRRDSPHHTPSGKYRASLHPGAELPGFDSVASEMLDRHWALAAEASPARRLGDFELLRVIGRGGMGIVYEAEQLSLRRKVALKLLPLTSLLDSRQIARFKNEAQAAAALQHPNIVPVYAIGSHQGVHYYAMPMIDGHPLDAIIAALRQRKQDQRKLDQRKPDDTAAAQTRAGAPTRASDYELPPDAAPDRSSAAEGWDVPTDARRVIRLGIEASSALAAAHEEGIIHRDIKPSNLLLDISGKVWITDFGLARRTNDHSLTATGDVLGTLRYMSPEQASGRGALVDSRSDIYSLGVTLYELLTLAPAMAGNSSPSLLRAIEQHSPVSLRHLRPDLPRDLVTVIQTAMAKDPYDRYQTAQALADDLLRVQEGRPILAKPPSTVTRAVKWATRHHRLVAAAALTLLFACLSLGVFTSIIIRKNTIAHEQTLQAQKAWTKLHRLMERTEGETAEDLKHLPGAEGIRRNLLSSLVAGYRDFIEENRNEPFLQSHVATALVRLGALNRALGELDSARVHLREARSLLTALVADDRDQLDYQSELALCAHEQGQVLAQLGEMKEAEANSREAVLFQEALIQTDPGNQELKARLAQSRNNLALLLADKGEREQAELLLSAARGELIQLIDDAPEQMQYRELLAAVYNNLCSVIDSRDAATAAQLYEQSIVVQQTVLDASPDHLPPRRLMAVTYSNLGKTHAHAGQLDQAIEAYDRAISIQRQLVAIAPAYWPYTRDLSVSLNNQGSALMKQRLLNRAEASFREAIECQHRLLEHSPKDASVAHELGGTYNNLATLLQLFPDRQEIDAAFERAVVYQRQAYDTAPTVQKHREFLDIHLRNYSAWLRKSHREERALAMALERRILWSGNARKLVLVASDLADAALEAASDSNRQGVAGRYADAAMETLGLAQNAGLVQSQGLTIQQLLSQQPFSSLTKIKSPTD